jgi:hypothetical protein
VDGYCVFNFIKKAPVMSANRTQLINGREGMVSQKIE